MDRNSQCVILKISILQGRVILYNCIYRDFQEKLYKIYADKIEIYIPRDVTGKSLSDVVFDIYFL